MKKKKKKGKSLSRWKARDNYDRTISRSIIGGDLIKGLIGWRKDEWCTPNELTTMHSCLIMRIDLSRVFLARKACIDYQISFDRLSERILPDSSIILLPPWRVPLFSNVYDIPLRFRRWFRIELVWSSENENVFRAQGTFYGRPLSGTGPGVVRHF